MFKNHKHQSKLAVYMQYSLKDKLDKPGSTIISNRNIILGIRDLIEFHGQFKSYSRFK
ncbi:hypothetical protein M2419_003679 [Sphingobacterium sp. BIGb0116]|nr:hypothetical protein [Sphingobacterium sp. BIGb0116]